jgi:hypothetical protein
VRETDKEQEPSVYPARNALSNADFGARYPLQENAQFLLDRYGLGQVTRLVDVGATLHSDVVREKL